MIEAHIPHGPATVEIGQGSVDFAIDGRSVGTYVTDDRHKPHLHPLRTLDGWVVTLSKPFDHPHHKGVMYGLVATDVSWWEEGTYSPEMKVGVQSTEELAFAGPGTIRQRIRWTAEDGTLETFDEERTIHCAWHPDGFVRWTWSGTFEVLRDVDLRQSPASQSDLRGRMINYHGLGYRFPRTFGWTEPHGRPIIQSIDGVEVEASRIMGAEAREVVLTDLVDGKGNPPAQVSVRVIQPETRHAIFFKRQPFCCIGIGPSNAGPVSYARGTVFRETYHIDVVDGVFP